TPGVTSSQMVRSSSENDSGQGERGWRPENGRLMDASTNGAIPQREEWSATIVELQTEILQLIAASGRPIAVHFLPTTASLKKVL
ncbi:hypothetical protein, partial [Pseudomonas aeruginosa]|uniref:hypothetical protein n=1 Tax=Pseudomonas aeruginosa TaxID=287 RepID=UPI001E322B5C